MLRLFASRPTLAGIAFMCLGIAMFSLNDVMGKWLLGTYTVGQLLLIRSVAALAVLTPAILKEGVANVARPPHPLLQVLRVVLATLEVAFFYWAVSYMPLAETVTFYLAGPIYVALLARPLLGETIPMRRWAAIALGFLGVVLALNPGGATFGWPALIAFLGSFGFALMMIVTRMVRGTSDTTLVAWQTVAALIAGAVLSPFSWTTPSVRDFLLLGLLGIVAMFAHMATNRSLKLAPANVVVPYQYTLIVWAVVLGWLVFGDIPAWTTLAGAAIIVVAGFWIFFDERRAS
ncbi:MAG TPA: DMT family transporter [Beijerinckiaceae bacterium]|nr:DMT family transporter [Beijerinckiaceae bacterium]